MKSSRSLKITLTVLVASLFLCGTVLAENTQTEPVAQELTQEVEEIPAELDLSEQAAIPGLTINELATFVTKEGILKLKPLAETANYTLSFTVEVEDPTIISVAEDGKWRALSVGETNLIVNYSYTEKKPTQTESEPELETETELPQARLIEPEPMPELDAQIIPVKVAELTKFDITPFFEGADIKGFVNDTGKITVASIEGIKMVGTFEPTTSADGILSIAEDGTWKALKVGSTTLSLTTIFNYSPESIAALEEKFPGYEFIWNSLDQQATIEITPKEGNLSLFPHLTSQTLEAKVSQTGTIKLNPIGNLTDLVWEYNLKDEKGIIEIDKKGNWKALKVGETELVIAPQLTAESLARLKKAYPENKFETPAASPEILRVKITADTTTSTSGTVKPIKPKKDLPQTSSSLNQGLQIIGLGLFLGATCFIINQRQLKIK